MKIIILSILFTISKAQFIDEQTTNFESSTITKEFESSIFQLFTIQNEIVSKDEEWFNVNQNKSLIFWKKIDDKTYILRSEGNECRRQMCSIKLKYNGKISKRKDGCLSFILSTNGQPIGQLWIEEDEQQETFSQKIQLTNSSLRVEHSLKSNIKNLSIDARILFTNSKLDTITLSNLNIYWNGSCPIHSSSITEQSTLQDQLTTEIIDHFIESTTTIQFKLKEKSSLNIKWILSLLTLFCFLIIFLSIIYGLWTIQSHYRFIWYIPYDRPIQFLFRRSIRSSTRSNNRIGTLSQILEQNNSCSTISLNSNTYF